MRVQKPIAASLGLLLAAVISLPAAAQELSPSPLSGAAAEIAEVVAFVPVLRFWTPTRDITLDEVLAAVKGRSKAFKRVVVAADDASGLWASLGVTPGARLRSGTLAEVTAAVESSHRTIGLVPAADVRPNVRALSVDGAALFGVDRLTDLAAWPLSMPAGESQLEPFDPARTWTLAAGGDVMLDREPYRKAVLQEKGTDYPWNGGFAEITSRTCCTKDGGPAITTKRVGRKGAVRELLSSADIAIVNHEAPAPDDHAYHPSGLVFTVDPDLLEGVAGAGIDVVSLANNHIRNAGSKGVSQTIRNLRKVGVRSFGAGADPAGAREPACFDQVELRVCLLGYDAINTVVHAVSETRAGAAELITRDVRSDVRKLRRSGADVVVVVPHWGPEYVTRLYPRQRSQAQAMVKAGADAVLGAHSHVVGPIEFIDGVPVLYSMGDLIFDLPRFEATEEGVIVELTFDGADLAQVELHPTVIVDRSQVNLLKRDGDGKVVMRRMQVASKKLD